MKLSYGIFYTKDLAKAKAFYTDKIGLELVYQDIKFISFKIGEQLLGIKIQEISREIPGHQTIIIETDNLDDLYEKFNERRVMIFSVLKDDSWGRNFSILDPDGNRVEFYQV